MQQKVKQMFLETKSRVAQIEKKSSEVGAKFDVRTQVNRTKKQTNKKIEAKNV